MTSIVECIAGVDPGSSGALSFYFPAYDRISVEDFPLADGDISPALLADRVRQMGPTMAVVERVGAMPGQGVSSMFKFGHANGLVVGVIGACAVPMALISPSKWKKHFNLSADKEEARALALRRFPSLADALKRKKDHGRAEAALIALYWHETHP